MKKMIKKILILAVGIFCFSFITLADPPTPPDPGGNPGNNGGVPVGAPIDDGVVFLLLLGGGYAAWKLYSVRKEKAGPVS